MAYLMFSVDDFGKITKQLITSEFIAFVYGEFFLILSQNWFLEHIFVLI